MVQREFLLNHGSERKAPSLWRRVQAAVSVVKSPESLQSADCVPANGCDSLQVAEGGGGGNLLDGK